MPDARPQLPPGLPTPTWADEEFGVALYRGDCIDILPQLPDGCVDVVVTDPPYGIAHPCDFAARGRDNLAPCNDYGPHIHGDTTPFDPSPWLGLGVPTVLFGANYFADKLPVSSGWLVWDKERPDDLDQSTCELAWTNCVKGVRRFRYLWNGMMRAGERRENYHPTQKPVALFRWIFGLRWMPDGLVLDPYMGSGPCGVAAVNLGRAFIGIEIDPGYFDIAVDRIRKAITEAQGGPMFAEHKPTQQVLFEAEA